MIVEYIQSTAIYLNFSAPELLWCKCRSSQRTKARLRCQAAVKVSARKAGFAPIRRRKWAHQAGFATEAAAKVGGHAKAGFQLSSAAAKVVAHERPASAIQAAAKTKANLPVNGKKDELEQRWRCCLGRLHKGLGRFPQIFHFSKSGDACVALNSKFSGRCRPAAACLRYA